MGSTTLLFGISQQFYLAEASFSPALVTRSDRDLVEVQRIRRQGDIRRLAALLGSGAIFTLPAQDRVRLLATRGRLALVQVLEGEHRQRSGWVRSSHLHPAPELGTPVPDRQNAPDVASPPSSERVRHIAMV